MEINVNEFSVPTVSNEEHNAILAEASKSNIRQRVGRDANIGDAGSREGKIKDVLDITAVHLLIEIIVCGEHPGNNADRMRFEMLQDLAGEVDILEYAKDRLAKIKSGEILLSAPAKPGGVTGALDEAFDASTAFVQILRATQGA